MLVVGYPIDRLAYVCKACGYDALGDQSVHLLRLDDRRDNFLWQIAQSLFAGQANRNEKASHMSENRDILLIGAGGHARSCIDVIEAAGFNIVGLVGRSDEIGNCVLGYPVLGGDAELPALRARAALALIVIGQLDDPAPRLAAVAAARAAGYAFPAVVSPHARASRHASVGEGSIVMHGAIVNAAARVGCHCIVNSQALIEHDALLGDFSHLSTRALLNGGVRVGERSFVGSGSVVRQGLVIGSDCFVAMGSVVRDDLASGSRVRGRH